MANDQKTVFITGYAPNLRLSNANQLTAHRCSSGIGQHLALEFKAQGYRVFATARKAESLSELASHGIEPMSLTVDDTASVEACYQELRTKLGPGKGLDYLVNNAGRSTSPIHCTNSSFLRLSLSLSRLPH
jgi:NAD(P)-dependent dehydrogenase (short-subunit alcohol dehydrogenase family)